MPPELKIPRWFFGLLGLAIAIGILRGVATAAESLPVRFANAAFWASLYAYISVSALDMTELQTVLEDLRNGSLLSKLAGEVPVGAI